MVLNMTYPISDDNLNSKIVHHFETIAEYFEKQRCYRKYFIGVIPMKKKKQHKYNTRPKIQTYLV